MCFLKARLKEEMLEKPESKATSMMRVLGFWNRAMAERFLEEGADLVVADYFDTSRDLGVLLEMKEHCQE